MIPNWREMTIEMLAEEIGPAAIVIVNDVAKELGLTSDPIDTRTYSAFLMRLSRQLPDGINAIELASKAMSEIMSDTKGGIS